MKRHGHLFQQIISIDNLYQADVNAAKGKAKQYGVQLHFSRRDQNLWDLHQALHKGQYKTSLYTCFTICEPKERIISRLPFYPDRIVHHAVLSVLEPIFVAHFTADTYSCIKKRGIHAAVRKMKAALQDESDTTYCLKLDIRKFYPSVNHDILKQLLRRKFKDTDLLQLLDEIIDSAPGLPIGNYLSQFFANYYLSFFDHWLKEVKGVRYYFRYADDLVILGDSKAVLHALLEDIKEYLAVNLALDVKPNHQVFPVEARGIDFVGYVFRHTHTRMRKRIKQRFAKAVANNQGAQSIASYRGWAKHCNARHLQKKLLPAIAA